MTRRTEEVAALRSMSVESLYKHVQSLQRERLRLESTLRGQPTVGGGNNRTAYVQGFKGNLERTRKRLARAKTILLEKQRAGR